MKKTYPVLFLMAVLTHVYVFASGGNDSLQRLNFQNKMLYALPENIDFTSLKQLNVSSNRLTVLPEAIRKASALEDLDISRNPMLKLPRFNADIRALPLKRLQLDECNLLYLPLELGELKHLEQLSLTNNYISAISEDYVLNPMLSYLDLGGNAIVALPEHFSRWISLRYLDLSKNPCLASVKAYRIIGQLDGLETLFLRNAAFCDLSELSLPQLSYLDISNGTFSRVEGSAEKLGALEKLVAANCNALDFASLESLLSRQSLREVELGGDNFTGFNNSLLSSSLTYLSLSGKELQQFKLKEPLTALTRIDLKFSRISCMPALMAALANSRLRELDVSACGITILPQALGRFETLEVLNLSMNELTNVQVLFSLRKLKELNVSGCGLNAEQISRLREQLPDTKIITSLVPKLDLPGMESSRESFSVSPTASVNLVTVNGTEIRIPANSMVYENGKPVTEPVTIRYQAFYSVADIAASGIHMNYAEDGELLPFRSAGMFALTASAGDKTVELRRGKTIEVKFKSLDSSNSYNYYAYDSIRQTWKETGKDSILTIKVAKQPAKDTVIWQGSRTSGSAMPMLVNYCVPQKIELTWDRWNAGKKLQFYIHTPLDRKKTMQDTTNRINYLYELQEIGGRIKWTVDEEEKAFRAKCFKDNKLLETWTEKSWPKKSYRAQSTTQKVESQAVVNFELVPDREKDNFIFRFYSNTDTFEFHAYPEFGGRDVSRIQKRTKKMYDAYISRRAEREKISAARTRRFKQLYELYASSVEEQREKIKNMNMLELGDNNLARNDFQVARYLTINGFGYHNCDQPISIGDPVILAASFVDENSKPVYSPYYSTLFIDLKSNLSIGYGMRNNRLPSNTVLTVVVTSKNKIYLGKYSTLGKKGNQGKETIRLTSVGTEFTFSDFQKYIETPF